PAPPATVPRRIMNTRDASQWVGTYATSQPAVLIGDFVVVEVYGQTVALRTREALHDADGDPAKLQSSPLIVVDFPPGAKPPAKDTFVSREAARGFFIR